MVTEAGGILKDLPRVPAGGFCRPSKVSYLRPKPEPTIGEERGEGGISAGRNPAAQGVGLPRPGCVSRVRGGVPWVPADTLCVLPPGGQG